MYESLGHARLKSGEAVEAAIVAAPDVEWAPRVLDLLGHKPWPWNEQNRRLLTGDVGLEVYFYLLHRDGVPFSSIMVAENKGVGTLGHVWTVPDDRRKGAASLLMEKAMAHVKQRGTRALYLDTTCDSPPYHLYQQFGFKGVEPGHGAMQWHASSRTQFENEYFGAASTLVQPLDWPHWPASNPLLTGAWPGVVRCAPLGIVGRRCAEAPLLPAILDNAARLDAGQPPRAYVLIKPDNAAVLGLACWSDDPSRPNMRLVDVYCHPAYWMYAPQLLTNLIEPSQPTIAYADPSLAAKQDMLRAAGFRQIAVQPQRVTFDEDKKLTADVLTFEKS